MYTFFDQGEAAMMAALATVNYAGAPVAIRCRPAMPITSIASSLGSPTQRGPGRSPMATATAPTKMSRSTLRHRASWE